MKTIKVAAAVIKASDAEGRTVIFATQRGYGDYKDMWEFPGGKIAAGDPVLREHEAARWLTGDDLETVDWLPADLELVGRIKEGLLL